MSVVYVADCQFGRGVFARQDFAPGDEILRFRGPHLSLTDALAKGTDQANALQIDDALYLDTEAPAVFVNHSCEPNAGIVQDHILIALRPITRSEEIQFDYSTTMWEGFWTMRCLCGSQRCRGIVRDFPELPAHLQDEYLEAGIVQQFIVRRLRAAISA